MAWNDLYTNDGVRAQDAALVSQWEARIKAAGLDDTRKLHSFTSRDLAEDLVKRRLLLAYQMGVGKSAMAVAAAVVTGTKHSLFVVPNKLIDEWRKEFTRLGFGDELAVITSLSQIDGYRCPAGHGEIDTFRRVEDGKGNICDVERTCEECGSRAEWYDRLPRFALISMRSLWTIPKDSPHAGREKKPERKDGAKIVAPARNRMKRTFAWHLRRRAEFVVVDEAYNLANPNALQTRAVFMLKPRRKWLLTGTPVRGYPEQVLSLLNWCLGTGSDLFPEYDATQESSLTRFVETYGTKIVKRRDDGSSYQKLIPKISNPDRFQALLAPVMRRRVNLEPDVASAIRMPNFMIAPEQIELDPNLRGLYEQVVTDFVAWWQQVTAEAKKTGAPVPSMTLLSKLTYLARLATVPQAIVPSYDGISSKQARVIELVKDATARGRKVIVFSEFVESAEWYANHPLLAKYHPVIITGSVSLNRSKKTGLSERERRLAEFRTGESQLLVATTNCMAEGYNLPESGAVIFDSFGWVPSVMTQAWSRVLRPAQKHDPVEIRLIGAAGTIDEFLLAINQLKRSAIGEGIDYEEVEFDLDDVPDPHVYANALVEASSSVDRTYGTVAWIDRLKRQAAAAGR